MTAAAMDPKWVTAGEIRAWRRRAHLSQLGLAEILGVAEKTVSNWETAKSEPTHSTFLRIVEECEHLIHLMGHLMSVPLPPGQLELDLDPARVLTSV
jgi:transcriptional regulator with XRE-family HTH domain